METNKLQTLDRGIVALRRVADSAEGLSIAELAAALGVHRAIAYRIVGTLEAHGMVHRRPDGRVMLGSGALTLAAQFDGHLRGHARPLIEALAEEARAAAFLSVAQGEECVAVLAAEPREAFLNINYRVGSRHPLNVGAAGIAILAGREPHPDDMEAVQRARRQGYSVTRGELQRGAVGLASPVPLSRALHPGLECSVGVVAMEDLDIENAASITMARAAELARLMGKPENS